MTPRKPPSRLSLLSCTARRHFGVVVSLITIIPLLLFCHLAMVTGGSDHAWFGKRPDLLLLSVLALGIGYVMLIRYPRNVARLRRYLAAVLAGKMPEGFHLLAGMDDFTMIERSLNLLVERYTIEFRQLQREMEKNNLHMSRWAEGASTADPATKHALETIKVESTGSKGLLATLVGTDGLQRLIVPSVRLLDTSAAVWEKQGEPVLWITASAWAPTWRRGAEGKASPVPSTDFPLFICEMR